MHPVLFSPGEDDLPPDVLGIVPLHTMQCCSRPFGDMDAEDLLDFARRDLLHDLPQAPVNALNHARGSYRYQVDRLLYALGLVEATRKHIFADKINALEQIGILPSLLLRTFAQERELMESDYVRPTREQAERVLGFGEFLLLATRPVLTSLPVLLRVQRRGEQQDLLYRLEPPEGRVSVYEIQGAPTDLASPLLPDVSFVERPDLSFRFRNLKESDWVRELRLFTATCQRRPGYKPLPEQSQVSLGGAMLWPEYQTTLGGLLP